jgi:dipeptidyl aminopeptidase/acylaminoacyl peptidase
MGRFVAVTRENALLAVEPGGRVHWSLSRARVSRPRWAPSGFRVAYLSGPTVHVVAGDGTGDREIGPGVAAEWRPDPNGGVGVVAGQKVYAGQNVLAVAAPGGRVRALDVDAQQTMWTGPRVPGRIQTMSWSNDSGRLLVATARALVVLDRVGRVARRVATPPGTVITGAAFAPNGDGIAVVRRRGTVSELALVEGRHERLLFAGAGQLGGVTWSPDGRWLLVAWPSADQFLFVRTSGPPTVEAAQGVAGEFDPRAVGAAGDPRPAGWCCSG